MSAPATITGFTLWHRRGPGEPWRAIGSEPSSAACTARMVRSGLAGDWLTLPVGRDPNLE